MKNLRKYMVLVIVLGLLLVYAAGCNRGKIATPATEPQEAAATQQTGEATEATQSATEATAPDTEAQTPEEDRPPDTGMEESELDYELDYELDWEDEIGTGPKITVTWETYESMSDTEQEAYRACFSNQAAFDSWEEMAFMDYEFSFLDEDIWGGGSLNLKEIIAMLIGEEL